MARQAEAQLWQALQWKRQMGDFGMGEKLQIG